MPHQCITEFDIVTSEDEQLAADYTRDTLIAVFSHSAYTSFLLWGFWEGSHWKPEAASWNKDWSSRARGTGAGGMDRPKVAHPSHRQDGRTRAGSMAWISRLV